MGQETNRAAEIVSRFTTGSAVERIERIGDGHIHASYRCITGEGDAFVLQRINTDVFQDPVGVMRNISLVLASIGLPDAAGARSSVGVPQLVEPKQGQAYDATERVPAVVDGDGGWWRMWHAVAHAAPAPTPADPPAAHACGVGFGAFLTLTADLDPSTLCVTIPRFHDIERRLDELDEAVRQDAAGRLQSVRREVGLVGERRTVMQGYFRALGTHPERVTHNDTKFTNILLDTATGEARAVIDLDTVMAGHAAYDFGDGARTGAVTAAEDTPDPAQMHLNVESFSAYADGFLEHAALGGPERGTLPQATAYMAYIMAVRFLTDHIAGDRYYHIDEPGHNLRRARAQLALVRDMEEQSELVKRVLGAG